MQQTTVPELVEGITQRFDKLSDPKVLSSMFLVYKYG